MKAVEQALRSAWTDYRATATVALVVVGLVVLALILRAARKSGRSWRRTAYFLGTNLVLIINAEGMYEVLTDPEGLDLSPGFVWFVFAVFEILLLTAMDLAGQRYRETTERYADDHPDPKLRGKVETPGHPGKMLYVVWFIALSSAAVVMTDASGVTEALLRLVLPVIVVVMWWATLTAEGQRVARRRFAFNPITLMEERGWLIPDGEREDLEELRRKRRVRQLASAGYRLESGAWFASLSARRAARVALTAKGDELAEATLRVQLATGAVQALAPSYAARRAAEAGQDQRALSSGQTEQDGGQSGQGEQGGQSGQAGSLPTGHAQELPSEQRAELPTTDRPALPAGTGQPEAERTEQGERAEQADGVKLTREQALALYGEQLVEEYLASPKGKITSHRVMVVTGLTRRPAEAVLLEVERLVEAKRREASSEPAGAAVVED